MVPVQEDSIHKELMQKTAPEHQSSVHPSVTDHHTEFSQTRKSTISNMGQIFPKYYQEYALVATIPGEIMDTTTRIATRTGIFTKAEVSDPYTMYFPP